MDGKIDKIKNKSSDKKYDVSKIREKYPNAYSPWSKDDDVLLERLFKNGIKSAELEKKFGRQKGSINSRLAKLGLISI